MAPIAKSPALQIENPVLSRLSQLGRGMTTGEFKVSDETFEDTCMDVINYTILLSAYVSSKSDD